MKIQYYGTGAGAGIPEIFCSCRVCEYARRERGKEIRTRSQAVIDGRLGIDYPVDTFLHTLYNGLDMRKITHVLITHAHHDHFLPADILSRPLGMQEPVRFYASEKTGAGLQKSIDAREEAFRTGKRIRTSDFQVEMHPLRFYEPTEILGYRVTPLRANHAESVDAMIFLIESEGKRVLWAHDTGLLHEEVFEYLKNSGIRLDLISLDCTLKRGEPITKHHMDLDWCVETVETLRENRNLDGSTKIVLSHIGHLVERTHAELSAEAAAYGMTVAYDGMTVEI